MSKPTPNWHVDALSPGALVMGSQVVVEASTLKPDTASIEEGLANIRLASAAPDLLSALEEILDLVDGKADIDEHGASNLAMKIQGIAQAVLKEVRK